MLSRDIFGFSLEPIRRTFAKRAPPGVTLEFVLENGLTAYTVSDLKEMANRDSNIKAAMAAEMTAIEAFGAETVYMWAENDDTGDHGCRQFYNVPEALAHVTGLLKKHAPIDGILGMSQGAMVAQLAAADVCSGNGVPPLKFALLFGGARPGWQMQRPDLFPEGGLKLHSFIISGAQDFAHFTRSDPGCKEMAALVAPDYCARHMHADGHTMLPRDAAAAAALVQEICDFMVEPQAVVAEYPARELEREAAAREAAELKRVAAKKVAMGGDAGLQALAAAGVDVTELLAEGRKSEAKAHESLRELLDEGGFGYLNDVLSNVGKGLSEWCELFEAGGRAELLRALKSASVEKLGDRQKLATLIGKQVSKQASK